MHARLLGERIARRSKGRRGAPLVRAIGDGVAFVFPYGVVVTVDVPDGEQQALRASLELEQPVASPTSEDLELRLGAAEAARMDEDGVLWLAPLDEAHLHVVADVLAKSVVLDHFETSIDKVIDRVEPLAVEMEHSGRTGRDARHLVRSIGQALGIRRRTLWHAQVEDKPDPTWDRPDLDRLYGRLAEIYELRERHRVLSHKLELLAQTASTLLGVLQSQRALRVEWYITVLIVFEIGLTLLEMWRGH